MAANTALRLGSMVVLARLLNPSDFGLMGMALVVVGFANAFADAGVSDAIIHRQQVTSHQLSSLYWLNIAAGLAVSTAVWLSTPLIAAFYEEPRLGTIVHWSTLSLLISSIGKQFHALLRRDMRFRTLSLIDMARNIASCAMAISCAMVGFGAMSLVWGELVGRLVNTCLLVLLAFRNQWLPRLHFSRLDLKGFTSFGLFQMGRHCVNYLASNIDYLVIGKLLGSGPLGYYTLAYNLIDMPLRGINPLFTSVAFPAFSRAQQDNPRLRRGYTSLLRYLSTATFPMMAGLFVVAPVFVPVVYGPQWQPAVPVVEILCLAGVILCIGNPLGSLLLAKGRADLGFWVNTFALVGYAVSNTIGAHWGIVGVAMSSLCFRSLIVAPITLYVLWRLVEMSPGEWAGSFRGAILAILVMLSVIVPLRCSLIHNAGNTTQLLILVSSGIVSYCLALTWLHRPLLHEAWRLLCVPAQGRV